MSPAYLILATFLACAVEAVEALTIVLAVGTTAGGARRCTASARPAWFWRR